MRIRTKVQFSGVPSGTTGIAEFEDEEPLWKITWDLDRSKPLVDWFDQEEFDRYLEVI